ncbi:MAG TPA: hypothetical protein VFN35_06615 [Ktedonobacteraceae bacterium]|nr:hypothetical protein [Ktedonobacteraceae bacterium]
MEPLSTEQVIEAFLDLAPEEWRAFRKRLVATLATGENDWRISIDGRIVGWVERVGKMMYVSHQFLPGEMGLQPPR